MTQLSIPITERDHAQGSPDAPVTLVEYGDYQCPDCGVAFRIVQAVQKEMGDQMRFVFRNFPLSDLHEHAENAAEVAECAGAQDKFWPMHDLLFRHQSDLDDTDLAGYASQVGLSPSRFAGDMNNHTYEHRVHDDFDGGVQSGVEGTPTFFINGVRHDDSYDADTLLAAIQRAAKE